MSWANFKTRWEYRSVASILKFIGVILFLIYIVAGFGAAQTLLTVKSIQRQPLDSLPQFIKTSLGNNDPEKVTQWIRFRPMNETEKLIEIAAPLSSELSPTIFFEFARRTSSLNKMEETLNWIQIARYRLRYDLLRCGADDSTSLIEQLLNASSTADTQAFLTQHPEHLQKSIQHVLDFDKKYPAKNFPYFICNTARKIDRTPSEPPQKEDWERIHETLRSVTEVALQYMKTDAEQPKAEPVK